MKEGSKKKKGSVTSLAQGLAVGAALGALIGVLFAPKKGSETRKDLEESFYRAKADVARRLVKAKRVTEEQYKKAVAEAVKAQGKLKKTLKKVDLDDIQKRLMKGWDEMAKTVSETGAKVKKMAAKPKAKKRK